MKKIERIRGGLELLEKYPNAGISAEHDMLYAGAGQIDNISREDRAALEKLGWLMKERTAS